jgi:hypothetical protein
MAVDPVVLAPILAQPGLPALAHSSVDVIRVDLGIVLQGIEAEQLEVFGYRFEGDRICRAERFETLVGALGPNFKAHVILSWGPRVGQKWEQTPLSGGSFANYFERFDS